MSRVAILNPGESLTAVMSGAANSANPHYSAEWDRDEPNDSNHVVGALAGATAVTLVSVGSQESGKKTVGSVRIYNADDAAVIVTLAKVVSGTSYTLAKITLQAADMLIFDERGLIVLDDDGQAKSIVGT